MLPEKLQKMVEESRERWKKTSPVYWAPFPSQGAFDADALGPDKTNLVARFVRQADCEFFCRATTTEPYFREEMVKMYEKLHEAEKAAKIVGRYHGGDGSVTREQVLDALAILANCRL